MIISTQGSHRSVLEGATASTSGAGESEEEEIWKQLTEYCSVAERIAVLRTLQVGDGWVP